MRGMMTNEMILKRENMGAQLFKKALDEAENQLRRSKVGKLWVVSQLCLPITNFSYR
jgi:negative regulator of genetic competence, sporulation and motility